jgi:hypothetical protein
MSDHPSDVSPGTRVQGLGKREQGSGFRVQIESLQSDYLWVDV